MWVGTEVYVVRSELEEHLVSENRMLPLLPGASLLNLM